MHAASSQQAPSRLICSYPPCNHCHRSNTWCPADALIFVVDSADRDRIPKAAQEFKTIIEDPLMRHSAILVFANKQARRRSQPDALPCASEHNSVGSISWTGCHASHMPAA